mmetsp:Transcript_1972/g.5861  ORF Transcript_1972/g.5861 Transcript_1972/m.5861 type:complete len:214 (-) Transcript_1972:65-706(-)
MPVQVVQASGQVCVTDALGERPDCEQHEANVGPCRAQPDDGQRREDGGHQVSKSQPPTHSHQPHDVGSHGIVVPSTLEGLGTNVCVLRAILPISLFRDWVKGEYAELQGLQAERNECYKQSEHNSRDQIQKRQPPPGCNHPYNTSDLQDGFSVSPANEAIDLIHEPPHGAQAPTAWSLASVWLPTAGRNYANHAILDQYSAEQNPEIARRNGW